MSMSFRDIVVLFEDDHFVAVHKPSGLLTIADRFDTKAPNLADLLRDERGFVFKVHRLDKPTSGVVLFAKHKEAHQSVSLQFEKHTIQKKYLALVSGRVQEKQYNVDVPIGEAERGLMKIDRTHGKPSETEFSVIESFTRWTWLEARPKTGRTHQIRIHCLAKGTPIVGDMHYGSETGIFLSQLKKNYKRTGDSDEKALPGRLALHAAALTFLHPWENRPITVSAPLPKDLQSTLNQLRKYAAVAASSHHESGALMV